ncbi:hypothetical protein C9422_10285 [Pseudomonas sp. B1(2018)]|uniref:hypothetical protein n=1 Tax=Pseudomonas sp. B1(2018) TaxID=2233856 RepID=UPI000D5C9FF7|nr:hypothetical protein [Pseudomonas sp. B1(2018)]PVZ59320.1 hypothetical protein C9422_10285 [Pseudomonas sp. B1(2018)]
MKIAPGNRVQTVANVEQIHNNTSQEVITITTDKLRLALIAHLDCVQKKDQWQMPLSLLVGVVVVFCSSTFKSAFGLSADSWAAMFAMFGSGCFLWFLHSLFKLRKATSLEDLIEIIQNKQA